MVSVNNIEQEIFKVLALRQRASKRTDIYQMHRLLTFAGRDMSYNDVLKAFKHMQEKGLGTLVVGRNNNPDRFKWNYNLKDVAQEALGIKAEVKETKVPGKRGRKPKQKTTQIVINIDPSKVDAKELDALVNLAKSLEGK